MTSDAALAALAESCKSEGDGSWFRWAEIADFLERFDISVHPITDARLIEAASPDAILALIRRAQSAEAALEIATPERILAQRDRAINAEAAAGALRAAAGSFDSAINALMEQAAAVSDGTDKMAVVLLEFGLARERFRAALSSSAGARAAEELAALRSVQAEAYKLAALCEDTRELRMGGADPSGPQAEQIRWAMDRQIMAVARAADRAHEVLRAERGTG